MKRLLSVVTGLWMLAGNFAQAQTIVSDAFSGNNGTTLTGRTPDGGSLIGNWQTKQNNGATQKITTAVGNPVPSANTGFNSWTYLTLGSYTTAPALTISADLRMDTIAAGGQNFRGIGLGYWSSVLGNSQESYISFYGLLLTPDGKVQLVENGNAGVNVNTFYTIAGFSKTAFYNLNYTVTSSTGAITSIFLNGTNITSSLPATTAFVPANLTYVGFAASTAQNSDFFGDVDNFSVVPEPGTAGLIGLGLLVLAVGSRRRWSAV